MAQIVARARILGIQRMLAHSADRRRWCDDFAGVRVSGQQVRMEMAPVVGVAVRSASISRFPEAQRVLCGFLGSAEASAGPSTIQSDSAATPRSVK